jgi:hypothetical protein
MAMAGYCATGHIDGLGDLIKRKASEVELSNFGFGGLGGDLH